MTDIHFDGIAEDFESEVYGTSKGYIRLKVLWEDLCQTVPELKTDSLDILDVGGGTGQLSIQLAQLGHKVVLADPSQDMLEKAREAVAHRGLEENVTMVCSSIQDLNQHVSQLFDLVLCHAVLEWVASPGEFISALSTFIKPGGKLSLMFYNQNATVFKTVLRGDFETYASAALAQQLEQAPPRGTGTFSGARGLATETVAHWLEPCGLNITSKSGIRIFHDHISDDLKRDHLPALLQLEKNYRHIEPFASLAQHIHLVCRRKEV